MAESLPFGSAAWTNGEEFGGEYAERINQFMDKINKESLISYASSLRGNQPCSLSPKFSVGSFNLVRKIQFDDGVEWAARLRMPPMPDEGDAMAAPPTGERMLLDMQSELATMEFVRHNTDIPIPRVYGYSLDAQNTVGCPFSIIEYINGNTAEEVARNHPGEHHGGIPAHLQEKFWRHIAKIMIQLASIRLPQIGSITRDGLDSFVVGPLVETGTGPYSSATEFYADYPLALSKSLGEQPASGQDELVQAFHSLAVFFPSSMARVGCGSSQGFGLANYDLNPNNVLVDREYNVLAVIDWDSVVSLHDAALYHFPFLMGISCAVPGVAATNLAVMKREQLSRQFAEIVEEVGQELAGKDQQGANKGPKYLLTKAGLFSKEAVTFRSLIYIKMRQGWVNNSWLQGLKWSREHNEMQVAKFYLGGSIFLEE